jgi:hypothetical protein
MQVPRTKNRITAPDNMQFRLFLTIIGNTLQRQYTENSKQIFPEMKLRGLIPNSYIYVSVSDLSFPTIRLPILLQ